MLVAIADERRSSYNTLYLLYENHASLQADVILIMTCAIREGAEQKVWKRLEFIKSLKKLRLKELSSPPLKIGILGE